MEEVKMKEKYVGSPDGETNVVYTAGKSYPVPKALAKEMREAGVLEEEEVPEEEVKSKKKRKRKTKTLN